MSLLYKIVVLALLIIGIFAVIVTLLFGYKDMPLEHLKAKYAKSPSAFITVDGMDVHYREEGVTEATTPIVLIHGTGSSLHTFNDWVSKLKVNYRIIRIDIPGHGLTGPFPNRDYSIEAYVKFIKHFLNKKGIDKCIIGGNSLGGHIAWQFTATHPDRVKKLILIDAAGYPNESKSTPLAFQIAKIPLIKSMFTFITPKAVARKSIENVYADKSKVTNDLAMRYFELTLRAGNRQAFVDRLSVENNPASYHLISNISQPTLILWGAQDLLIPTENAKLFQKDIPNNTLIILKNTGHVPMEENPSESLEAVIKFLKANN
jgi:pimeloyl-ACP methyl ester carboxylesterase